MQKIFNLTNLTLIVALALSAVAAYYSIIGLTAIFAGAVIPVIVMGTILEIGKITTTVWLRKYWNYCGKLLRLYLVLAVIAIAVLTSMGIFGYLSKAHMDSGLVSGDVQAKLSLIDEKIKVQRENIDTARKALAQLDAQVNERLSRGNTEQGVERAATLRRQQAPERTRLLKDVNDAQNIIQKLNEERAPLATQARQVEAEVGPIKYVAALIYGDDPDLNLLERAVRWVIILLVVVFDPLAIALVLAANTSRDVERKFREEKERKKKESLQERIKVNEEVKEEVLAEEEKKNSSEIVDYSKHSYLHKKWVDTIPGQQRIAPIVYKEDVTETIKEELKIIETVSQPVEESVIEVIQQTEKPIEVKEIVLPIEEQLQMEGNDKALVLQREYITKESPVQLLEDNQYILLEGKQVRKVAAEELRPDILKITADLAYGVNTSFGSKFPKFANKGDFFVRIDFNPNRVFKFDGKKWIEVNKSNTQTYLNNEQYIQYLISKIDTGEYEIESLSEHEQEQVKAYLEANK